jgi:hypothetical protein
MSCRHRKESVGLFHQEQVLIFKHNPEAGDGRTGFAMSEYFDHISHAGTMSGDFADRLVHPDLPMLKKLAQGPVGRTWDELMQCFEK